MLQYILPPGLVACIYLKVKNNLQSIYAKFTNSLSQFNKLASSYIGGDINKQDSFGRTPLHVAVSVDFAEMAEFLLQNNADIDARTSGELQAPIHFAAKNGAVNSLQLLLGYQANIDSLDCRQRTPLQVSTFT